MLKSLAHLLSSQQTFLPLKLQKASAFSSRPVQPVIALSLWLEMTLIHSNLNVTAMDVALIQFLRDKFLTQGKPRDRIWLPWGTVLHSLMPVLQRAPSYLRGRTGKPFPSLQPNFLKTEHHKALFLSESPFSGRIRSHGLFLQDHPLCSPALAFDLCKVTRFAGKLLKQKGQSWLCDFFECQDLPSRDRDSSTTLCETPCVLTIQDIANNCYEKKKNSCKQQLTAGF